MIANSASRRDIESRERLIEQQLPLVESLARRYAHRGEPMEDLVQVGTCGPIRVPRRYQETSARMRSTRWQLAARLQRNPTAAELAAAANLNEGELDEAMRAEQARTPLSLTEADPAVSAGEIFDASEDRLLIWRGLRSMHRRERLVLGFRYFEDLSQEEIAARLGISQTQTSRLIASGLAKLRADFDGKSRCAARQEALHSWHGDSASRRGSTTAGDRGKAALAPGEA